MKKIRTLPRPLRVLFSILALLMGCTMLPAQQPSTPPQWTSFSGSLTAPGTSVALPLYTGGFSMCGVVVSGNSAGVTATAQTANDSIGNPANATWVTASNVGSSGAVSTNGTYVGNVAQNGLSWFRVNLTAITSGTYTYTETCTTALSGAGGGGGGGSVTQGTTPWIVGVASTPFPVSGSFNATTGCNYSGAATPTPFPAATSAQPVQCDANANLKVNVINTPNVTVFNTPGVTVQNTPGVACVSGCLGVATPYPTASAGLPGISAPAIISENACAVAAGSAPTVTAGNVIAQQCDVSGNTKVNVANTPGVTVQNTPGVAVANTPGFVCVSGCSGGAVPTPLPTASAGAPPTAAPPVIAEGACFVPAGATPNTTGGNIIANQCQTNGSQNEYVTNATVSTPLPTASAGLPPTPAPPVIAQGTCVFSGGASVMPSVASGNSIACQAGANGVLGVTVMPPAIAVLNNINLNISTATTTLLAPSAQITGLKTYFLALSVNSAVTQTLTLETSASNTCTSPTTVTLIPIVPGPNPIFPAWYSVANNVYECLVTGAAGQISVMGSYIQAI